MMAGTHRKIYRAEKATARPNIPISRLRVYDWKLRKNTNAPTSSRVIMMKVTRRSNDHPLLPERPNDSLHLAASYLPNGLYGSQYQYEYEFSCEVLVVEHVALDNEDEQF